MIARLFGRGKSRPVEEEDAFEPEIEPSSQLAPPKPGMLPTADYYLATLPRDVTEITLSPREATLMFTIPARIKEHSETLRHLRVTDQPSIRTIAPHQLRYLKRLRTLTLSGLKIHTLPSALGELAATLTALDLSNDTFSEVPPVLCQLTELRSLDLSDNELGDVPREIEALHNLEEMYLSRNVLREFPNVTGLPRLRLLELYGNRLRSVPDSIGQLKDSLQTLGLWGNGIRRLPSELCDLENLEVLFLSSCALTRLPAEISNLRELRILDLEWNGLASLPPAMSALQKLRVLRLGHNFFGHVPAAVHAMRELREFTCSGNDIEALTHGLSGKDIDPNALERAETVAVSRERAARDRFAGVRGLSGWISEAAGKEEEEDDGSGASASGESDEEESGSGSESDGASEEGEPTDADVHGGGSVVTRLDLGGAAVVGEATTPRHAAGAAMMTREGAAELQSGSALNMEWVRERQSGAGNPWSLLTVLDLSSNRLEGLHFVGPLLNLRHLDLSDNHLVAVPPGIGKLAALEELDLRRNRLVRLPREVGQLLRLRVLRLSGPDQQLEALPLEICGLGDTLSVLEPCESLTAPPAEVVRQGMDEMVHWFRERAHRLQHEELEARRERFADERESALDEATEVRQWWQLDMPVVSGLDGTMERQAPAERVSLERAQTGRWTGDDFEAEALREGGASSGSALRAEAAASAVAGPSSDVQGEGESQAGSDTMSEFSVHSVGHDSPFQTVDMAGEGEAGAGGSDVGKEEVDPDANPGFGGWVIGLLGGEGAADKGAGAGGERNNP